MTFDLDRRSLLALGSFGLGAASVPGAAALAAATGFTHSVASGEPSASSAMLWTRYVPGRGRPARLRWEVAASPAFTRILAGGSVEVSPDHDWCVKPVATGLPANRWLYYRFVDAAGRRSPTGRTRTLPDGPTERFGLGIFSCSNLPFGWFNAYAHAAARDDLDLMVHLGDYLYEYERGHYPDPGKALPGRLIDPAGEILHLADYRLRYASYRADPDLQALHRRFPMVAMWDDHESANDSWQGGAENHQPATEGAWDVRKAAATRAYREWMPVGEADYRAYRIGDLADLFRPETRLTARSQQLKLDAFLQPALAGGQSLTEALTAFRDGPWRDPARTIMGAAQERQLADDLKRSVRDRVRWQLLAQQTVMGEVNLPAEAATWPVAEMSAAARQRLQVGLAASALGLPINLDNWDGYPRARERLLASAAEAGANFLILSGDSHNAWAFDHRSGTTPAGVEFAGQSVTSPGFESSLPFLKSDRLVAEVRHRNPALQWANLAERGYLTLTLTPAAATGEWLFLSTIRQRSTALSNRHRLSVRPGRNRLEA